MKRLIAASLIIVFILASCIVGKFSIDYYCKKTKRDLISCRDEFLSTEGKTDNSALDTLINNWKRRKTILAIFVNHNLLDTISVSINRLSTAQSEEIFMKEYAEILWGLQQIVVEESIRAETFY